jgi:hypothetical protein
MPARTGSFISGQAFVGPYLVNYRFNVSAGDSQQQLGLSLVQELEIDTERLGMSRFFKVSGTYSEY